MRQSESYVGRYSCYHNDRPLQLLDTDGISKPISAHQHPESFCDRRQTLILNSAALRFNNSAKLTINTERLEGPIVMTMAVI